MSNSPLVSYTRLSPNRTSPRRHAIDTITIHCVVGQWTATQGCDYFAQAAVEASPNYFVGKDGSVGLSVDEGDRSWCSSNGDNDHRAITIETASDTFDPYAVTDEAYAALVDLVTDICRRNGARRLLWFADKEKTLAYTPGEGEMVMTVHRWFANKACPGDYLYQRHGAIAAEVTKRLNEEEDTMTQEQFDAMMEDYLSRLAKKEPSAWSAPARAWAESQGIINGNEKGEKEYRKFCTREELVQILYNQSGEG